MKRLLILLFMLICLAACQAPAATPSTSCVDLSNEWGAPSAAIPPEDLLLLGMLPVGTNASYTIHYSADEGSVWVWYFYDDVRGFCGPYVQKLTR